MIRQALQFVVLVWLVTAIGCASTQKSTLRPPTTLGEVSRLDGSRVSWGELTTTPHTLLAFMTLWCEPCKREQPELEAWVSEHPHVHSLLVVSGSEDGDVRRTLNARDVRFPHGQILLDREGRIADAYGVTSTPTLILLRGEEMQAIYRGIDEVPDVSPASKEDVVRVTVEDEGRELGTSYRVRLTVSPANAAQARASLLEARQHLHTLERVFSDWVQDSELNRVNQLAHHETVQVSDPLRRVLVGALHTQRATGGAFSIAWRTLAAVWEDARKASREPTTEEIGRALRSMGPEAVQLSKEGVRLSHPDTVLGVDGVAKGWIIDAVFVFLRERGYEDIVVNIGGDLRLGGRALEGNELSIADPYEPTRTATKIRVSNTAVATSGNYVRGKHILDPRTGYPPAFDGSVTVLAPDAAMADALATALFVLGPKEGLAFARSTSGVEAIYVTSDGIQATLETLDQREQSTDP